MPMICYKEKRFKASSMAIIEAANEIIENYQSQGYELTLRQLYYQFVSKDLFPDDMKWALVGKKKWVRDADGTKNADPNYKFLGGLISDARMAGLTDWDAIVDRTRAIREVQHWGSPAAIIKAAHESYRIDKHATQVIRPEVWIEKDALVGIFEPICRKLDVGLFSCRGYTSQSEMWGAAMRFKERLKLKQFTFILHFGDHDPSGVDMTRDIRERIQGFLAKHFTGAVEDYCKVIRMALTSEQIKKYNPPPNPAKLTDSRSASYVRQFGDESWELDALAPEVLVQLVKDGVAGMRQDKQYGIQERKENKERAILKRLLAKAK